MYGNNRSSHQRCSIKNAVLKNFAVFTGKHPVFDSLFNKVAGFQEHLFSRTTANDCFCNISLNGLRTPTNGRHFINLVSHYGISSLLSRIFDLLLKVPYRGTHISLEIFWVLVVYCCLFISIDHFLQNFLFNEFHTIFNSLYTSCQQ